MKTIGPNVWGPHGWKFMHYVSLGYPQVPTENDKRNYKEFYSNLKNVLPCKTCAINYERNLTELPIDNALQSRDSLVKWVIEDKPVLDYCFKILVLIIILCFLYQVLKK